MENELGVDHIISDLNRTLSSQNKLKGWQYYLKEYLRNSQVRSVVDDNHLLTIKNYAKNSKKFIQLVAEYIMDDKFARFVIESIGVELMKEIVWGTDRVNGLEMSEKYGIPIYSNKGYYRKLNEKFAIFKNRNTYSDPSDLYFPDFINHRFRMFFKTPDEFFPITHVVNNEDEFARYNMEKEIFTVIPRAMNGLKIGTIKKGTSGSILKAGMTALRKEAIIKEIFPKGLLKKTDDFSILSILNILSEIGMEGTELDVVHFMDTIFANLDEFDDVIYDHLMKIYKGNKTNVRNRLDYGDFINAIANHREPEEWVFVDDFESFLKYRICNLRPVDLRHGRLKIDVIGYRYMEFEIERSTEDVLVNRMYHNGFIYFLASLGLVEVLSDFSLAHLKVKNYYREDEFLLPFNSLVFFRMTKLGRYIFGVDDSYDAPKSDFKPVEVILSGDNLTITLSEKDEALTKDLSTFSKKLGDRLFQVDRASFLKRIDREWQLKERKEHLKVLVNKKVPQNWVDFLKSMDQVFDPMEEVYDDLKLFKLPNDNPSLIKALMTDPILRTLYVKVDGRQLMVMENNYVKFKNRMRELGWVLNW